MGHNPAQVDYGIWQVMPMLVLPISLSTGAFLVYYAWTRQRFIEILPLLIIQINSLFVWFCTGYYWYYNERMFLGN